MGCRRNAARVEREPAETPSRTCRRNCAASWPEARPANQFSQGDLHCWSRAARSLRERNDLARLEGCRHAPSFVFPPPGARRASGRDPDPSDDATRAGGESDRQRQLRNRPEPGQLRHPKRAAKPASPAGRSPASRSTTSEPIGAEPTAAGASISTAHPDRAESYKPSRLGGARPMSSRSCSPATATAARPSSACRSPLVRSRASIRSIRPRAASSAERGCGARSPFGPAARKRRSLSAASIRRPTAVRSSMT